MYFCGLKGMMPGILETLEKVAEGKGLVWEEKLEQLKKNGQWHVEVY
jgi:ferredoxin--NADP+ reductase